MLAFVIVLQVVVALFLIGVVLLQPGNRGGASAALGGAGSDTVFGARGANTFLSKITFGAAVLFMATNLGLSFMSSPTDKSKVDSLLEQEAASAPAAPAGDSPVGEAVPTPTDQEGVVPTEAAKAVPAEEPAVPQEENPSPTDTPKQEDVK